MEGGAAAAAAAVVGAGEVRHWECCVKRVEASESQTKEAAATFSAPPPPPPLADRPSSGATSQKKKKDLQRCTGKRDPPPLACGPDTGDRNTYFWVALLFWFFFTGVDSAGRVSCLSERLRFSFHLSPPLGGARRFAGLRIFLVGVVVAEEVVVVVGELEIEARTKECLVGAGE